MADEPVSTGKPLARVDGPLKVTGGAKYAAEYDVPDLLHGVIVPSSIAKGKITGFDTEEAIAFPGVLKIFTHQNRPWGPHFSLFFKDPMGPPGRPFRPLHNERIHFSGQPVALVVADTFEAARDAAALVRVSYREEAHATDLEKEAVSAYEPPRHRIGVPPTPKPTGDAGTAMAAAPVKVEATYRTSPENHHPMELLATTVHWGADNTITVYDKTQSPKSVQIYLKTAFLFFRRHVRVLSPYVGGAFGLGLRPQQSVFLAVLAAKALKRSVRIVIPRDQMYTLGYRAHAIQTVALGADEFGRLQALKQDAIAATSRNEDAQDPMLYFSGLLYRCDNVSLSYKLAKLDTVSPCDMRGPGATTGMFALESAMDELSYATGQDPLALRYANYTSDDQMEHRRMSSKALMDCYEQGAEKFGWSLRTPAPRSMRDGRELIGWGMATGIWDAALSPLPARATVTLTADNCLEVATSVTDIGTGTYTILTQLAADAMQLPVDRVTTRLGDSSLPYNPTQGGSWTAATAGSAVQAACDKLKKKLLKHSTGREPFNPDMVPRRQFVDLLKGAGKSSMKATATITQLSAGRGFTSATHSAVFAEVRIDEELGVIRVTRIVSAIAAGRILNPLTAQSQIRGASVMAIGKALHEDAAYDHNLGRCMAHSFADYHIPSNADIFDLDVIFVDEKDEEVSPIGAKGLGEIGSVAVAPAIANAVFHATGHRVRELPITIDRLLPGLPRTGGH
ncbi:Periplasmic aromatic aldehyde oxidoreductase, molybdenum binding subunit YagR [Acidisarcina polymorpha]|uniref:Periplasmic aromatic aldehyde oxidoreductase, molybdenum binding subunit YagR n=1 Tax=Acidisarcina polymorpha TaxID=2211140 RepID=A0A2Z5GA89_9BACT|nr:xanthine dehydrogenase family protein molybdopterin-binding subunit [Acidisarcina polymorpha]AXC15624.1 Periplasmic aromatic aldehyde oxidoreductase, molybdenum binding subunit YagR [Acidisarcina polymorpha]